MVGGPSDGLQFQPLLAAENNFRMPFSSLTLVVMFIILAASVWVFVTLVKRETFRRRELGLRAWAGRFGLRLIDVRHREFDADVLSPLSQVNPKLRALIQGESISIMQMRTDDPPQFKNPSPTWNLLLMKL